jgi:hypothetical protein
MQAVSAPANADALARSCQQVPPRVLPRLRIVVRSLLSPAAFAAKTYPHQTSHTEAGMKVRTSIAAIGAAALLGGGGAMVVPAIASATAASHTLKFTSVTERSVNFSKTTAAQQDRDLNSKGKIIGFDELYFAFNLKTGVAKSKVTVVTKGGMLYGSLTLTQTSISGKVTGGTGKFKGAAGTITARNLNSAGTRTAVTIRYH